MQTLRPSHYHKDTLGYVTKDHVIESSKAVSTTLESKAFARMVAAIEAEGPTEDDYQTSDHSHFYQYGKLVLTVDRDATTKEMWEELEAHMNKEEFWPNVWFISDHGNAHLMKRED